MVGWALGATSADPAPTNANAAVPRTSVANRYVHPHFCVAFLTERSRYRQSNGSQLRHLPRSHLWCRSSRTLRSPLWRRLYHRSISVCYQRRISFPSSLLQAEYPLCSGSTPPLTSTRHHVPRKTSRVQYFKTRILLQSYMQPLPRTPLRRHFRQ